MEREKRRALERKAWQIRKESLKMIHTASSGHIGGSLSLAEILAVLYDDCMDVDPLRPDRADRDRLVLSKGHCSPALYSALALKGFFPLEELAGFRKIDSRLSGHVEIHVPGVDMSSGSLGQGLSVALGMALCGKFRGYGNRVFCILGDGEIEEGQVWEAAMAAAFYRADNLTAIVDNNHLQLDGRLEEVMAPYPIAEKFRAFGWDSLEVDGHDVTQLHDALSKAAACGRPCAIVADTVKGKGVSAFEDQVRFHGGQPTPKEWEGAFQEIDGKLSELGG